MRLQDLSVELLARAMDIYFEKAYPDWSRRRPGLEIPPGAPPHEILSLARFEARTVVVGDQAVQRFVRQLGNLHYPFMKMVLQEHLFPGDFCFAADTHDDIEVPATAPDFDSWVQLKEWNRRLKREIEAAWEEAGIPTHRLLGELAARREGGKAGAGERVLVADDEEEVAAAVVTLLNRQGYRARAVFDGRQALAEVRRELPDLLIMDLEMPFLTGLEVIDQLRQEEGLRRLPVLLVTAGPISLSSQRKASGFLCKPFSESLLLNMVRHLLGPRREPGGLAPPPGQA